MLQEGVRMLVEDSPQEMPQSPCFASESLGLCSIQHTDPGTHRQGRGAEAFPGGR